MITAYPLITAHLWQSTLVAAVVGMLTLLLKKNGARTRYWVWLAAVVKFLVPFGVLVSLGGNMPVPGWVAKAPVIVQPAISFVMGDVSQPVLPMLQEALATPKATDAHWPIILFGVWACGFVVVAFRWIQRWMRVQADVHVASPLPIEIGIPVLSSPVLREPGVFGIFWSVLLLPEGMAEHFSKAEWEAILAHEICHARCYDNLTAAIYMLVETIFWFHPLVWWMGKRLVTERELACDEEVLRLGSEPKVYAEGILKVCELYLESPLECVAGVTGSNLRRRIRSIMIHRGTEEMNLVKRLLLVATGMLAVAGPLVIGMMNAPIIQAQSQAQSARSAPAPTPKFEVASIRPCAPVPVTAKGQDGGGKDLSVSPGRLNMGCLTVADLIHRAYVTFADGQVHPLQFPPMEGGPTWIRSTRYDINAKAAGSPNPAMMQGPMLQALLEDRFKLKIHRETREVPIYALTVAKGGSKLQPLKNGSCITVDGTTALEPGQKPCGVPMTGPKGPNLTTELLGSLEEFSKLLGVTLGRPVMDKTGIAGAFDFHLEFAIDEATPGIRPAPSDDPPGPTIFTAVQEQLGLKLESAKGPGEFLIIDSVAKPSEN